MYLFNNAQNTFLSMVTLVLLQIFKKKQKNNKKNQQLIPFNKPYPVKMSKGENWLVKLNLLSIFIHH